MCMDDVLGGKTTFSGCLGWYGKDFFIEPESNGRINDIIIKNDFMKTFVPV